MTDEKGSLPAAPTSPTPADRKPEPGFGTLPKAISGRETPETSLHRSSDLGPGVSETREERSLEDALAAATAAGTLTALPGDFGDASGHWTTVRSTNPFTVLYLDYRLAAQITPTQVAQHRELLQKFWQEKLRSMSQGAARIAILKKYGGSDESERLVRSFPELIERAYEQLATRSGIDEVYRKIVYDVRSAVLKQVDARLDDFLLDGILHPQEIRALLQLAHHDVVPRTVIAARIEERLRARALAPAAPPVGVDLEDRLLSTTWQFADPRGEGLSKHTGRPGKSPLVPLLLFSTVVVVVLLISAALIGSRSDDVQAPPNVGRAGDAVSVTEPANVTTVTSQPELTITAPVRAPVPRTERAEYLVPPATRSSGDEATSNRDEEIRKVQAELDEIEQGADRDPTATLEQLDALDARLATNSGQFMAERLALANLRSRVQKLSMERTLAEERERAERASRDERDREWEQRLAQIETFIRERNYSGAKKLANELLAEPALPDPVAERARSLSAQALAELQREFSKATAKSRTGRAPRGQHP